MMVIINFKTCKISEMEAIDINLFPKEWKTVDDGFAEYTKKDPGELKINIECKDKILSTGSNSDCGIKTT